jgi:predicted transcriptional regulator
MARKHEELKAVRMDSDAIEALTRIGKELDRSISWLIRAAVSEYIERYRAAKRAQKQSETTKD